MSSVVLVACGATKLEESAPASELYTGQLFRKARAYAERTGTAWFILSAEHGLLRPDTIVEPYDTRLPSSKADRMAWGARAGAELEAELEELEVDELVLLAGRAYVEPIVEALQGTELTLSEPMAGMMIGERLSWLKRENATS